jgi:uncharacterized membrane protein YhaH (DUF805 family)
MLHLFNKRTARAPYVILLAFLLLVMLIFARLPIIALMTFIALISLTASRLKDIGWSRWIAAIPYGTMIAIVIAIREHVLDKETGNAIGKTCTGALLIFLIALAFIRSAPDETAHQGGVLKRTF